MNNKRQITFFEICNPAYAAPAFSGFGTLFLSKIQFIMIVYPIKNVEGFLLKNLPLSVHNRNIKEITLSTIYANNIYIIMLF